MTRETYIRAVLECNFAGYKEEIIETAVQRIMECEAEYEPIIHCKDCKYYGDADSEEPEYHECRYFSNWATVHYILESDFCSCAEKGKAPL